MSQSVRSTLLAFEKLHNIRDLGGMRAADGRTIRPGRLIRGGHLADLVEADARQMEEMVSVIVDFRTPEEVGRQPDRQFPGVEYHHLPAVESLTEGISREEESDRDVISRLMFLPDKSREYMAGQYRIFATSDRTAAQYAKFIDLLTVPRERAVFWHCTAGKDRAGLGAIFTEEILGVPREDIIEDYLYTNECLAEDVRMLSSWVKKNAGTNDPVVDRALGYLFGADESYIETFYNTIDNDFGGMDAFLRDRLGVTEEKKAALRSLYLT